MLLVVLEMTKDGRDVECEVRMFFTKREKLLGRREAHPKCPQPAPTRSSRSEQQKDNHTFFQEAQEHAPEREIFSQEIFQVKIINEDSFIRLLTHINIADIRMSLYLNVCRPFVN